MTNSMYAESFRAKQRDKNAVLPVWDEGKNKTRRDLAKRAEALRQRVPQCGSDKMLTTDIKQWFDEFVTLLTLYLSKADKHQQKKNHTKAKGRIEDFVGFWNYCCKEKLDMYALWGCLEQNERESITGQLVGLLQMAKQQMAPIYPNGLELADLLTPVPDKESDFGGLAFAECIALDTGVSLMTAKLRSNTAPILGGYSKSVPSRRTRSQSLPTHTNKAAPATKRVETVDVDPFTTRVKKAVQGLDQINLDDPVDAVQRVNEAWRASLTKARGVRHKQSVTMSFVYVAPVPSSLLYNDAENPLLKTIFQRLQALQKSGELKKQPKLIEALNEFFNLLVEVQRAMSSLAEPGAYDMLVERVRECVVPFNFDAVLTKPKKAVTVQPEVWNKRFMSSSTQRRGELSDELEKLAGAKKSNVQDCRECLHRMVELSHEYLREGFTAMASGDKSAAEDYLTRFAKYFNYCSPWLQKIVAELKQRGVLTGTVKDGENSDKFCDVEKEFRRLIERANAAAVLFTGAELNAYLTEQGKAVARDLSDLVRFADVRENVGSLVAAVDAYGPAKTGAFQGKRFDTRRLKHALNKLGSVLGEFNRQIAEPDSDNSRLQQLYAQCEKQYQRVRSMRDQCQQHFQQDMLSDNKSGSQIKQVSAAIQDLFEPLTTLYTEDIGTGAVRRRNAVLENAGRMESIQDFKPQVPKQSEVVDELSEVRDVTIQPDWFAAPQQEPEHVDSPNLSIEEPAEEPQPVLAKDAAQEADGSEATHLPSDVTDFLDEDEPEQVQQDAALDWDRRERYRKLSETRSQLAWGQLQSSLSTVMKGMSVVLRLDDSSGNQDKDDPRISAFNHLKEFLESAPDTPEEYKEKREELQSLLEQTPEGKDAEYSGFWGLLRYCIQRIMEHLDVTKDAQLRNLRAQAHDVVAEAPEEIEMSSFCPTN